MSEEVVATEDEGVREDGMIEVRMPVDDVTAEVVDEGSADVRADEEDMEELAGDEVSTVEEAEADGIVSEEESGVEERARDEKESKVEVDCVAESDEVGRRTKEEEEDVSEVDVDRSDKDEEVASVEEEELDRELDDMKREGVLEVGDTIEEESVEVDAVDDSRLLDPTESDRLTKEYEQPERILRKRSSRDGFRGGGRRCGLGYIRRGRSRLGNDRGGRGLCRARQGGRGGIERRGWRELRGRVRRRGKSGSRRGCA